MGRGAVAAAVSLLFACALRADTLQLCDQGRLQGSLEELLVRVDGVPRAYARAALRTAALSGEGDLVELADGATVRGTVISMTFRCAGRLYALGRSKVRAVELDGFPAAAEVAPTVAPAESPTPRARPLTPDELEARKRSLVRNEALCQQFQAKARKAGGRAGLVLAMAEQIRLEVQAGRFLTDGQMFQRYEAALTGKPFREPARTQLRSMAAGVKLNQADDPDTPELVVEPFPEMKY